MAGSDDGDPDAPRLPPAPPVLPSDLSATRNIPHSSSPRDLGIPQPPQVQPDVTTQPPFERPALIAMERPRVALLGGRALMVLAAAMIGLVARQAAGADGASGAFWPAVAGAGVLTAIGLAGQIYWAATLAENGRRLRIRATGPRAMVWFWLLPVAWVALSCLTYLQIEVDAELDPLPGVAALGWIIAMTAPYGSLQGVFRGLSRTPPILWLSVYPIDLLAFGFLWWRLTDWPSPVAADPDAATLVANTAFGVAAAMGLNLLLFIWLAQQGTNAVFERLGRLEAQHRPEDVQPGPEWFQTGQPTPTAPLAPTTSRTVRPLIPIRSLGRAMSVMHILWGLLTIAFGVVLAQLTFEYSDVPVFIGDELVVADADADRVELFGGLAGVAAFVVVVTHGVWAVLAAINGRRVTLQAPNPFTFVVAFAPVPILVLPGLVVGGNVGYWMVAIGLSVAFFALIFVNQLLMALAARLGGDLSGFGRWSSCLALTYLAGVLLSFLFSAAQQQLGLYATLAFVQGALIVAGGVMGYSATVRLDETLRSHRQLERVEA